jgi:hypothetical protein
MRGRIYRRLLHTILFFFWLILLLTKLLFCVSNVSKFDHHIYFIYSSKNNNGDSNIVRNVRSAAHQWHVHCLLDLHHMNIGGFQILFSFVATCFTKGT